MLTKQRLHEILTNIGSVNIGIIGDFCVDIYWNADMTKSELSRETPHYPLPVVEERTYPGAAGNAAANIAALGPKSIRACGIIGDDWRGELLKSELKKRGILSEGFTLEEGLFTYAYCKPMRKGISDVEYEDPRLDFANYRAISPETEAQVIEKLDALVQEADILCVSDQFEFGIVTDQVRERILSYARNGLKVVVDSRNKISRYTGVILKPNEVECWRAVYGNEGYLHAAEEEFIEAAKALAVKNNALVMQTLGGRGSLVTDGKETHRIDAVKLDGPLDICGAGDTFLSAFSSCLAAGAAPEEAASVASLASAVTVQKIGVTGTATAEEILRQFEKA
ncbi:MAG: PfkB family carbohydrate kinase [Oscillospiraceae bacterium]|jgi:rfaE bifunctional protein kinase chain/domain|nr:PfkB family carbohydrate kinase [Oscillospiraceae bacterium]